MRLLLPLLAAALCRPAAAIILVIEQHDDTAEYQLEDSPSQFGPHVSMTGLGGYLVLSEPLDGCSPVSPPPSAPGHHHWLLLLSDGGCAPGLKVLHAQRAGYLAAVVFNTTGDGYSPMESDVDVNIPSFYIGLSNGIMLRTNFLYGSGYSIYISGYFPYTFLAFVIPAMMLIVLCMLVLIAVMLYRCICEYRRTARRLLPKRTLAQIPTRRYSAGEDGGEQETCAICLEDYQQGDRLRLLPCKHAFHCACVDPWLLRSRRVCPVCKRRLISATVAVLASESEDEQLLPVYRSQRLAPSRRSYGATLTGRTTAAAAAAAATGEDPPVSTRPRSLRRHRRSRRRQQPDPTAATTSAAAPPAPDTVTVTVEDVTGTADDVRLLTEDRQTGDQAAVATPADYAEATVAPYGGARPKLRPGQYTRLQESSADCSDPAAAGGDGSRTAETGLPEPPAPGADLV